MQKKKKHKKKKNTENLKAEKKVDKSISPEIEGKKEMNK